jgi:rubrerythrin
MYPVYLETAKFQKEPEAENSFNYALQSEKTHWEMFPKAKETVDSTKKDIALKPVGVCLVCGWTHEGELPDKCPICGATRDKFRTFA